MGLKTDTHLTSDGLVKARNMVGVDASVHSEDEHSSAIVESPELVGHEVRANIGRETPNRTDVGSVHANLALGEKLKAVEHGSEVENLLAHVVNGGEVTLTIIDRGSVIIENFLEVSIPKGGVSFLGRDFLLGAEGAANNVGVGTKVVGSAGLSETRSFSTFAENHEVDLCSATTNGSDGTIERESVESVAGF